MTIGAEAAVAVGGVPVYEVLQICIYIDCVACSPGHLILSSGRRVTLGIDLQSLRFIVRSRSTVSFDRFLMLGRQFTHVSPADVERELGPLNLLSAASLHTLAVNARKGVYSEPILAVLGARQIDSMDFSSFEQATIVHDINKPIADSLREKFTCVYDGGTLEHVFDFPTAIRNAMEMVAVGGHYMGVSPANNQSGHGFYQFSPDLYWRVFSEDNGFEVEEISICEARRSSPVYRIEDPMLLGHRVMFTNDYPAYVLVRARRLRSVPIFQTPPQQPYYEAKWNPSDDAAPGNGRRSLRHWAKHSLPEPVKQHLRNLLSYVMPPQVRTLHHSRFKKI